MDIDKFVEHINENKQSVMRGLKELGLDTKNEVMTKAIKDRGYEYNSKKKEWVMGVVHTSSHVFTQGEQKKKNVVTIGFDDTPTIKKEKVVHTSSHDVNSHKFTEGEQSSHEFTSEEIQSIKAMLNDWKKGEVLTNENDLLKRIEAIPSDDKERKTIVISKDVGKRLDKFCKENRVLKSNVLELAIVDFISKYSL